MLFDLCYCKEKTLFINYSKWLTNFNLHCEFVKWIHVNNWNIHVVILIRSTDFTTNALWTPSALKQCLYSYALTEGTREQRGGLINATNVRYIKMFLVDQNGNFTSHAGGMILKKVKNFKKYKDVLKSHDNDYNTTIECVVECAN